MRYGRGRESKLSFSESGSPHTAITAFSIHVAALEIKIPSKWTIDRAVEVYGEIWDWYVDTLSGEKGKEAIIQFDAMFPDTAGISDVPPGREL